MKSFIILLCVATVFSRPADEQTENTTSASNEAAKFWESLPDKFEELLTEFAESLRELLKDEDAARVILEHLKGFVPVGQLQPLSKDSSSDIVSREPKKYEAILARLFDKKHKDVGRGRPEQVDSSAIASVIKKFDDGVANLIADQRRSVGTDLSNVK